MTSWLPLELECQQEAESRHSFPRQDTGVSYWNYYTALVTFLRGEVYPSVNAGLACLSRSPGLYTDHGPNHFDEVVRYAGLLLSPGHGLNPFELYLLLAAIRVHDAGNIDGREDHERRALHILNLAGDAACPDSNVKRMIADIAQAHGGKRPDGGKDTISLLRETDHFGPISCRPRLVAALVRFADEICEHRGRAATHHLKTGTIPAESKLFHLYAKSVKGAAPLPGKAFFLNLDFEVPDLAVAHGPAGETKFLIDEVVSRIEKLDRERTYTNRFLLPHLRTESVKVQIDIHDPQRAFKHIESHSFVLTDGAGYPEGSPTWSPAPDKLQGSDLALRLVSPVQVDG